MQASVLALARYLYLPLIAKRLPVPAFPFCLLCDDAKCLSVPLLQARILIGYKIGTLLLNCLIFGREQWIELL